MLIEELTFKFKITLYQFKIGVITHKRNRNKANSMKKNCFFSFVVKKQDTYIILIELSRGQLKEGTTL